MISPTLEEGERIAGFLDLRTPLSKNADLAFVFGTHRPDPAYIAADLWIRGIVAHVVLTRGKNRLTGQVETDTHLEILLRSRVPREHIIVESRSANTQENVVFALEELSKWPGLEIRSLVVVAKWYHCRRAIMTLRRYMPEGVRYFASTYPVDGITPSGWWLTEEGRKRVAKEQQLISQYLERGDIAQVQEAGGSFI